MLPRKRSELDDRWLIADERLTLFFSKAREMIVGRVRGEESPYVQGTQYSEEDLVVWKKTPRGLIGHQSVSLAPTGNMILFLSVEQ